MEVLNDYKGGYDKYTNVSDVATVISSVDRLDPINKKGPSLPTNNEK